MADIFQTHHDWPHDLSEADVWHNLSHPGKAAIFPIAGAAVFGSAMNPVAGAFTVTALTGMYLSHAFHRYAHSKNPPLMRKALQKVGLAVSPEPHYQHHKHPDDDYCLTNGMHNGWMRRTNFWRHYEAGLFKLGEAIGPKAHQAISGSTESWEPNVWSEYPSTKAFALGEISEEDYQTQWKAERADYHERWKVQYQEIKAEKVAEAKKKLAEQAQNPVPPAERYELPRYIPRYL